MSESIVSSSPPLVERPDIDAVTRWLDTLATELGPVSVASLGPAGTSADGVLRMLVRGGDGAPATVDAVLCPDFVDVMDRTLDGSVDLALVPSAYRDATAFHWHPELVLAHTFVHGTPRYGLAAAPGGPDLAGRVVVAAMSEVRDLLGQLALEDLAEQVVHVTAASTSDAAAMVAGGRADVALCNELGRQEHGLHWVGSRPGVDMVWMLFARRSGRVGTHLGR